MSSLILVFHVPLASCLECGQVAGASAAVLDLKATLSSKVKEAWVPDDCRAAAVLLCVRENTLCV